MSKTTCPKCGIKIDAPAELNVTVCSVCRDEAKVALTEMVTTMHTAGFSLQFNCFSGEFEIVEQDMNLDIALNRAKDCR